jgi:hypothetical protein
MTGKQSLDGCNLVRDATGKICFARANRSGRAGNDSWSRYSATEEDSYDSWSYSCTVAWVSDVRVEEVVDVMNDSDCSSCHPPSI